MKAINNIGPFTGTRGYETFWRFPSNFLSSFRLTVDLCLLSNVSFYHIRFITSCVMFFLIIKECNGIVKLLADICSEDQWLRKKLNCHGKSELDTCKKKFDKALPLPTIYIFHALMFYNIKRLRWCFW